MAEEPSLSYYLPIAGGRIIGFIPFMKGDLSLEIEDIHLSITML